MPHPHLPPWSDDDRVQYRERERKLEYNIVSLASFAFRIWGVRGITSEQSSYHKLRLVLRGDLDLFSNLFLGVLLGVDLTDLWYMYMYEFSFFAIGVLNEDFREEADSLLFDLMELGVLLFKGGGEGGWKLCYNRSLTLFLNSQWFFTVYFFAVEYSLLMRWLGALRNCLVTRKMPPPFSFENPHLKVNKKIISSSKSTFCVIAINTAASLYEYDWLW